MSELHVLDVIWDRVLALSHGHDLVRRDIDEFGIGIDKALDQPWTGDAIDVGVFSRDPLHLISPACISRSSTTCVPLGILRRRGGMKQLDGPGMREGLRIAARGTTPAAFAAVMATAIVSTAAERYHMHLLSVVLVALAAVILAALAVLTAARFAYFPTDVATDWGRPQSAFGFLTFVAGVTVLGERLDELGLAAPALFLVGAGILSWVILSYGVQLRIML